MGWKPRITPFLKQCFAVSSVALNMLSYGLTIGYNATLFTELRKTKEIPLDINSESWLASLIGITICFGSIVSSFIMDIVGRKPVLVVSGVLMVIGWILLSFASSFPILLMGKIVQGIAMGVGSTVGGILVAEYSSPKYRGPFIASIPPSTLIGGLIAHAFGVSHGWHDLATVLIFFSLPGLIVAVLSPESPSFLVKKERYDESRKIFHWLRGPAGNDEIEQMIRTNVILRGNKINRQHDLLKIFKRKVVYIVTALKKRECRMPLLVMMHLSAINQFSGAIVQEIYPLDFHTALYGTDVYMFKIMTSLDAQRIIATFSAMFIASRLKRRSMMLIFVGLNIVTNLVVAGYIYIKQHGLLPFDHLAIGIILHHIYTFINGAGCLPLFFIIGGEIYPLADKGFCAMIVGAMYAIYMFINVKSAPYLYSSLGVDGTFGLYALILSYNLVLTYILLPETKDRTLQEVEDEFRGYTIGNHDDAVELNTDETKT